jgi:hypothetical protein
MMDSYRNEEFISFVEEKNRVLCPLYVCFLKIFRPLVYFGTSRSEGNDDFKNKLN